MERGHFFAEVGVAKVPDEGCRSVGVVFELNLISLADLIGTVDGDVGVEFAQFEFENPHVAIGARVVWAPSIVGGGEVIHPPTTGANGLIYRAILIEPR